MRGGVVETVLGLGAVVEALGGERSYWALAHGAAQPDFHREDSFVPWTGGAGAGA